MEEQVAVIADQIAIEMRNIRMERARQNKLLTLSEAFVILKEIGEVELAEQLLQAGKRIGDKLCK